jgi:hypothetical protein
VTASVVVLVIVGMIRQPHFIDDDKGQVTLLERLSAFLYRHHLWDQFLAEDAQGKR